MLSILAPLSMHVFLLATTPVTTDFHPTPPTLTGPTLLVNPTASSDSIPRHLFMPPNPPAPGRDRALSLHLPNLLAERTTNYRHASVSQAKNIELVAERLNGVTVRPGETFSYFAHVGPYTAANGYGWGRAFMGDRIVPSMAGGVCQGASTLYSALLRTGLPIVERHNHGLTVPYLPAGEDATVSSSANLDFRFRNNQSTPILITAGTAPDLRYLTISIWGAKPRPNIEVKHRVIETYPIHVIHRDDKSPESQAGDHVLFPGQEGAKVNTWLCIRNGKTTVIKDVSVDVYQSSPRIVD